MSLQRNTNIHQEAGTNENPTKPSLVGGTVTVALEGETDHQNEEDYRDFAFQEPPDVTFIVDGVEFPCHFKILNKECTILRDFVSDNGIQRRRSKKQRWMLKNEEGMKRISLPSTTTVVELHDVEHKIFRVLLEFLYTGEIPPALYWNDQNERPPSSSLEDRSKLPTKLYWDDEDDTWSLEETSEQDFKGDSSEESPQEQSINDAMQFLQKLLIAADRYGMISLKHEVEYKLYDEFLYSFTSPELFVWADSHSCAFLKEKAMDRICKKNGLIDDFTISRDGWTIIRQSKRLLEELFLFARYAPHGGHRFQYNDEESGVKSRELDYYKIDYLRFRLSKLGLDTDGTRKMLEDRLRPHLDANDRHFLPTKLTQIPPEEEDEEEVLVQRTRILLQQQNPLLQEVLCCSLTSQQSASSCSN